MVCKERKLSELKVLYLMQSIMQGISSGYNVPSSPSSTKSAQLGFSLKRHVYEICFRKKRVVKSTFSRSILQQKQNNY